MLEAKIAPGGAATAPSQVRASVVVLNYNGRGYLDDCLGSLLADKRADYELILFDNASTDGSPDYVEQHFPGVRVIRNRDNRGYAGGNNQAASYAAGKFLAFLNPDTEVRPGWLEALVTALAADPQAGLATSQILMLQDRNRINTCGSDVHCSGLTLCRGLGQEAFSYAALSEVSAASGAAFAIRRELFAQLGGFDQDFFMYLEDTDLSWRAWLAGYKCLYVPQSVIYHDYKLRFGPQKTYYQERNRYLMMLKVYHWATLLALLPAYLLAEFVTWGFVLSRDRSRLGNKLRVYAWIVGNWRQIMASRRQTQALRRVPDRVLLERCTHALAYEQTGGGIVATLAHLVFDPLFLVFYRLALGIVHW